MASTNLQTSREKFTLQRAAGCTRLRRPRYRGRIGLHELLLATPAIKKLIHQQGHRGRNADDRDQGGMRTLKQDGIEKICRAHTDVAQIRAVAA